MLLRRNAFLLPRMLCDKVVANTRAPRPFGLSLRTAVLAPPVPVEGSAALMAPGDVAG